MPYSPPVYKELQCKSKELELTLAPCFIHKSYLDLRGEVYNLQAKYDEAVRLKNGTSLKKEIRYAQIECIRRLYDHLPAGPDSETDEKNCQLIILGAAIYRHQRLWAEHTESMLTWVGSFFWDMRPEVRCALYNVLHLQTLDLKDGNALDDRTIFLSCEAYRSFLRQDGVIDQYPYIKEQGELFFTHLQALIDKVRPAAQLLIEQSGYIHFIQSVASSLLALGSQFYDSQDLTKPAILQTLSFAQVLNKGLCSRKTIRTYLETEGNLSSTARAYVRTVIWEDDPNYTQVISPEGLDAALEKIQQQMLSRNQYALLGAYVLVLKYCSSLPDKGQLIRVLQEVIHSSSQSGPLDYNACDLSLEMLNDFIRLPEITSSLNTKCWRNSENLIRQLSQLRTETRVLLIEEAKTSQGIAAASFS